MGRKTSTSWVLVFANITYVKSFGVYGNYFYLTFCSISEHFFKLQLSFVVIHMMSKIFKKSLHGFTHIGKLAAIAK